jgi:hypothetical protein
LDRKLTGARQRSGIVDHHSTVEINDRAIANTPLRIGQATTTGLISPTGGSAMGSTQDGIGSPKEKESAAT